MCRYGAFLLARRKLLQQPPGGGGAAAAAWARGKLLLPVAVGAAALNFELVLLLLARRRPGEPIPLATLVQHDLDTTIRLLKGGAQAAEADPWGYTALHWAAARGRPDLIAVYLHQGAPIDGAGRSGCTALHKAALHGRQQALRYLIQAGADCSLQDAEGRTALEVARRHGFASEDLVDCFAAKKPADGLLMDDMQALLQQVDLFTLRADLAEQQPAFYNGSPEGPAKQRRGRFLIERLIHYPRQWWGNADKAPSPS